MRSNHFYVISVGLLVGLLLLTPKLVVAQQSTSGQPSASAPQPLPSPTTNSVLADQPCGGLETGQAGQVKSLVERASFVNGARGPAGGKLIWRPVMRGLRQWLGVFADFDTVDGVRQIHRGFSEHQTLSRRGVERYEPQSPEPGKTSAFGGKADMDWTRFNVRL